MYTMMTNTSRDSLSERKGRRAEREGTERFCSGGLRERILNKIKRQ